MPLCSSPPSASPGASRTCSSRSPARSWPRPPSSSPAPRSRPSSSRRSRWPAARSARRCPRWPAAGRPSPPTPGSRSSARGCSWPAPSTTCPARRRPSSSPRSRSSASWWPSRPGRAEHLGAVGWTGLALGTLGVARSSASTCSPGSSGPSPSWPSSSWATRSDRPCWPGTSATCRGRPSCWPASCWPPSSTCPVVALGPGCRRGSLRPGPRLRRGARLVCTAGAFLLFALVGEIGPVRATAIVYVNPVVAVVAGAVVLGERITATTIAGFALVLAGSYLATRRPASRPDQATRRLPWRHDAGRGAALGPRPARPRHRDAAAAAPRRG